MKLKPIGPQPPTEPGWYFVEHNGRNVVEVLYSKGWDGDKRLFFRFFGDGDLYRLDSWPFVWQPVAKPEEA